MTDATGGHLSPLSSFDGFDEWLNHPITQSLLARVENKRERCRDDLDTMRPCAHCKKERDDIDKDHRAWTAGMADAFDAVAVTVLSGQQPRCTHITAEAA